MPKAENRKRPPNLLGQVPGRGSQMKSDSMENHVERENVKSKKQALLDKMKHIQQTKNPQ